MNIDEKIVLGRDEFESVIAQEAGLHRGKQSEAFSKHDGIYINDSMQKMWVGYQAAKVVLDAAVLSSSSAGKVDEQLHKFINCAAGDGLILDGVDAADLYVRLFHEQYAEACKSIHTGSEE